MVTWQLPVSYVPEGYLVVRGPAFTLVPQVFQMPIQKKLYEVGNTCFLTAPLRSVEVATHAFTHNLKRLM